MIKKTEVRAEPGDHIDPDLENESDDSGPSFEAVVAKSLAEAAAAPAALDTSGRKPVESWAVELKTADWLFAAAKMHARWPRGREVTQAEYEAAVEGAANVTSR